MIFDVTFSIVHTLLFGLILALLFKCQRICKSQKTLIITGNSACSRENFCSYGRHNIERDIKHEDCYYYNSSSPYYAELNERIGYDGGVYRIDDSGGATRKWTICPTLKANMGTYPDRVPVICDAFGIRKITPLECLAFQGFPKAFRFKGITLDSAYKQCGNTVCVPVVKSIAKQIKKVAEA